MKKKVLYGVFMACFAALSMGTLQSCTDDLDTFKHQYAYDQYNLDGVINDLKAQIDSNMATCQANIADLQRQITDNDGDITKLQQDVQKLQAEAATKAELQALKNDVIKLENDLKAYSDAKDEALQQLLESKIQSEISGVTTRIDDLELTYNQKFQDVEGKLTQIFADMSSMNTSIQNLQNDIANAWVSINANTLAIEAMDDALTELEGKVDENAANIAKTKEELADLKEKYDAQFAALNEAVDQAFNKIEETQEMVTQVLNYLEDKIDSEVAQLQNQIDGINTTLDSLQDQVDALKTTVNDLITSILIQGTDNPVFGNFSLPLGIQSNLLFNWYFENLGEGFTFPNAGVEYSAQDHSNMTPEEVEFVKSCKNSTYEVPAGYEDVNLGKLYVTLNPVGHNLTEGKTFCLETSKGKEGRLPFEVKLTPSNDELYFGYTRGIENGFYESEVTIPGDPSSIAAAKIEVEQDLKNAVKAILNDRSKRTALNLVKAVYDQMNSTFKSYALRADWMDADKASRAAYSVLSKYDLAVATAKPLSFKFLAGQGTDHRLRTFGHIDNFFYTLRANERLHFNLEGVIDVNGLHFNFDDLKVEVGDEFVKEIVVTIPPVEVKDKDGEVVGTTTETTAKASAESIKEINAAIKEALEGAVESIAGDMGDTINDQIDEMVANVESQIEELINGKIDSVLTQLGDKAEPWFQRLNKLVDIYNRVANKVNDFLKEPNQYLQPAVFYKANGGLGMVSLGKFDPTVFENGGGEAFVLYPTTFTAELVAPVYKKFVACSNVYTADGSVYAGAKEEAKKVNMNSGDLARVLDSSAYSIVVKSKGVMKAGLTYEFMYQALDYSGVTSTRKFYIKVK